jgi:hypothetical protein
MFAQIDHHHLAATFRPFLFQHFNKPNNGILGRVSTGVAADSSSEDGNVQGGSAHGIALVMTQWRKCIEIVTRMKNECKMLLANKSELGRGVGGKCEDAIQATVR